MNKSPKNHKIFWGVIEFKIIELDSEEMSNGKDRQLRKGIEILKEKMKENPKTWPKHKPYRKDEQLK